MKVCVFEDKRVTNLWPITATRPVYEILLGTSTLLEKIASRLGEEDEIILYTRPYLEKVVAEKHPRYRVNRMPEQDEEVLLINGRLVVDDVTFSKIGDLKLGQMLVTKHNVAALRTRASKIPDPLWRKLSGEVDILDLLILGDEKVEAELDFIEYPWSIITFNAEMIRKEARGMPVLNNVKGSVLSLGLHEVEENVVLDGRSGPVILGDGVTIESFSKVSGPCFLGDGTRVFSSAVVSRCSFGPVCRIGGEVEESVFLGYSNKRHYGFVGHSVVGEWVNFGAGTTVSNLKNTYGTVRVVVAGERIDSGLQFLGSFFGDHVKTGIGCMISGGVKIGVLSHLYREVNKDVPSFTIHTPQEEVEMEIEPAFNTVYRMMMRRNLKPSENYLQMLLKIYEMTQAERASADVKKKKFSFYNGGKL